MTNEHFIAGKDAALETSIARMQQTLAESGFHVEEISWLNPIKNLWSVHLRDRDCPLLFTNGKGASQLAARASALGEFFERLASHYFWSHYYLGEAYATHTVAHYPQERWFALDENSDAWPPELLTPSLQDFYNPEGTIPAKTLVERNSGDLKRGICTLPMTRLRDDKCVFFPINILGNLYVSNGLAAGNTPSEARVQALCEIIERHVKFRIIGEALALPDVPEEVLARFPNIAADITALRAAGFGILVKDASLGGQYPVVNVSLLNPKDQGCFCSFGAHPCFEVALERALTELLQGRALDALDGFPEPGFDADEVASAPNLEIHFVDSSGVVSWNFLSSTPDFAFCDWNFNRSSTDDYDDLLTRLHAAGYDVYIAEHTQMGVYVCRIVVPGFSEIYPIDDLEYENNSVGNALRAAILDLPALDEEACADLLDALNESDIDDQRPVAALIGLAPDLGSLWEELRVGELKTWLALAAGDAEALREGCNWVEHFGQINPERRKIYRCLETLLRLDEAGGHTAFQAALEQLYGAATLRTAHALLTREMRFFNLSAPGLTLAGCEQHQRLLSAYEKVRRCEASAKGD